MSALIAAEEDGDRLTREETAAMVANLLIGGHDTTTSQIGCTVLTLLTHPESMAEVRAAPENIGRHYHRNDAPRSCCRIDGPRSSRDVGNRQGYLPGRLADLAGDNDRQPRPRRVGRCRQLPAAPLHGPRRAVHAHLRRWPAPLPWRLARAHDAGGSRARGVGARSKADSRSGRYPWVQVLGQNPAHLPVAVWEAPALRPFDSLRQASYWTV